MERLILQLLCLLGALVVVAAGVVPIALMLYMVAQRTPAFETPLIVMGWAFMLAALGIVVVSLYQTARKGQNKGEGK